MDKKRRLAILTALLTVAAWVVYSLLFATRSDGGMSDAERVELKRTDWKLVFFNGDVRNGARGLYAYRQGASQFIADSPVGSYSLDNWVGYSEKLGAVLFYRPDENHFRTLKLDLNAGKITAKALGRVCNRWCNAHTFSVYAGKLWQVKGAGHHTQLCSYEASGKCVRVASWDLPKSVGVTEQWLSAPSIQGSKVAFVMPSAYVMLANFNSSHVSVVVLGACLNNQKQTHKRVNSDGLNVQKLARGRFSAILARRPVLRFEISEYSDRLLGDRHFRDPGYGVYPCVDVHIAISPQGDKLTYVPAPLDVNRSKLCVLDLATMRTKLFTIHDPRGPVIAFLERISSPIKLNWIPNTDFVACELMPGISGMDVIALVNVRSGAPDLLPIRVDRQHWCIIPGAPGS